MQPLRVHTPLGEWENIMDIKEIGVCGVVVVGGAIYGISQVGLGEALSEELRPFHEVPAAERADYMQQVVDEFSGHFDTYFIQTPSYDYMGHSTFSSQPLRGLFDEVVSQDETVPREELPAIKAQLKPDLFCAQDEMTMFTDKGWQYRFKLKDGNGRLIATVICHPSQNAGTV